MGSKASFASGPLNNLMITKPANLLIEGEWIYSNVWLFKHLTLTKLLLAFIRKIERFYMHLEAITTKTRPPGALTVGSCLFIYFLLYFVLVPMLLFASLCVSFFEDCLFFWYNFQLVPFSLFCFHPYFVSILPVFKLSWLSWFIPPVLSRSLLVHESCVLPAVFGLALCYQTTMLLCVCFCKHSSLLLFFYVLCVFTGGFFSPLIFTLIYTLLF